jgi:UDP-N-acetylglucosamine 4-epimerase
MKILVTGGAGFIGSNLVEYFLHKEYKVVGLDNFSTGHLHNIAPLEKIEFFTFIKGNIKAQAKL